MARSRTVSAAVGKALAARGLRLTAHRAAVVAATCKNPVDAQYNLGAAVGLEGTPALYTKSGVNIRNGSPQDILAQLQKSGG